MWGEGFLRPRAPHTVGRFSTGLEGKMAPPRGCCPPCPLPRKHQHVLWWRWPCLAGLWLPARLGHQPSSREQGQGAGKGHRGLDP